MSELSAEQDLQVEDYLNEVHGQTDKFVNITMFGMLIFGIILSFWYDTWQIAVTVGPLNLAAFFGAKFIFKGTKVYQYVAGVIFPIFMAQFIYQMHGMFEMHFFAFVGAVILIGYQNWKLQIPVTLTVVAHHATFAYLQYSGMEDVYFTQLEGYMNLQTFIFHVVVAAIILFTCGYWGFDLERKTREFAMADIQISNQVNQMEVNKYIAEEISKGNLEVEFDENMQDDELGQALLSMRDSLVEASKKEKADRYIADGINRIGELFQLNSSDAKAFYDSTISYLVPYLNFVQGAIYIVEKDENDNEYLERVSTYAYDRQKFVDDKIYPGQGLVGQCYLEKKPTYLTNVPNGYVNITSGLGQTNPQVLLIFPLITNNEVLGVIEVASMHDMPDHIIKFMEKASESMASSIKTVVNAQATKRLLAKSGEQQEVLQQQEEEMRQSMEELNATKEEMEGRMEDLKIRIRELEAELKAKD